MGQQAHPREAQPRRDTAKVAVPVERTVAAPYRTVDRDMRRALVATSVILVLPFAISACITVWDVITGYRGVGQLRFAALAILPMAPLCLLNWLALRQLSRRRRDTSQRVRMAILLTGATVALCVGIVIVAVVNARVPQAATPTIVVFWCIACVLPVLALRAMECAGGARRGLRRMRTRPRARDWRAPTIALIVSAWILAFWWLGALYIATLVSYRLGGVTGG